MDDRGGTTELSRDRGGVGRDDERRPAGGRTTVCRTWFPHAHVCFSCNDLTKHETFECSRDNWQRYFKSTIVFPLRYKKIKQRKHEIVGFLTFDCKFSNVFGNIADIFEFKDKPEEYNHKLLSSTVYHVGGLIADTLATAIYLQEGQLEEN